jgi:DNA-binding XRE family transcriptional regulator
LQPGLWKLLVDDMAELSLTPAERSRKAYSRVLQAMQEPGTQRNLSQVLGVSEATVSRIKSEKLEDAISLMCHLGFKVVPTDMRCYPAEYVQALHTMAKLQMQHSAPTLEWDA